MFTHKKTRKENKIWQDHTSDFKLKVWPHLRNSNIKQGKNKQIFNYKPEIHWSSYFEIYVFIMSIMLFIMSIYWLIIEIDAGDKNKNTLTTNKNSKNSSTVDRKQLA